MDNTEDIKLTQDQIESIVLYLRCFRNGYYSATGKKLETAEQIIDLIRSKEFTFEDVFMTYIDQQLDDHNPDYYWDDHMEQFACENFFPGEAKNVGDGMWIKVRTDNGFQLHYAKRSIRRRRFEEEYTALSTKMIAMARKQVRNVEQSKDNTVLDKKTKIIHDKLNMLKIYAHIGLKPYEVVAKISKSKSVYFMPYQYEIVDDINEFIEGCMNSIVGINIKATGKSDNEEAVFYLRSRGISEGMARIMTSLKHSYFDVDMKLMMDEYNRQWKENVVIVES